MSIGFPAKIYYNPEYGFTCEYSTVLNKISYSKGEWIEWGILSDTTTPNKFDFHIIPFNHILPFKIESPITLEEEHYPMGGWSVNVMMKITSKFDSSDSNFIVAKYDYSNCMNNDIYIKAVTSVIKALAVLDTTSEARLLLSLQDPNKFTDPEALKRKLEEVVAVFAQHYSDHSPHTLLKSQVQPWIAASLKRLGYKMSRPQENYQEDQSMANIIKPLNDIGFVCLK